MEEKVEDKKPDLIEAIVATMSHLEGAPKKEDIEAWKAKYKNIQVFGLSNDDIFIFRSINRAEYRELQSMPDAIRKANPNITDFDLDQKMKDKVCKMAVLYPSDISEQIESLAGLATMLAEQIYYYSCIISPEEAVRSIRKL